MSEPENTSPQTSAEPTPPVALTAAQLALSPASWAELPLEAQVERLRHLFKLLDRAIADLRQPLRTLEQHQHGPGGELLVPLRPGGGTGIASTDKQPDAKPWI